MSKRRNENGQMRREDYEQGDDGDSSGENGGNFNGGFERAPEAAIARRKIVTARVGAKKPIAAPPAPVPVAAPAAPAPSAKGNAFAGFQGLVAPDPPARANPFAGFSGLTAAAPAQPATSLSFGTATSGPMATPSSASKAAPTTYREAIEVLNKEFLDFVSQQLKKNPSSDWSAATQDYAKHAQEIGVKFASTKPVAGSVVASAMAAARPVASAAASSTPSFLTASKKEDSTPTPGFSFGAEKDESPAPSSGFSFGAKKDTPAPAAASNGFSFGSTPAAKPATPVTGGFSFGSTTPAPTTAAAAASSEKAAAKPASSLFSFGAKPAEEKPIPAFSFGAPKAAETTETAKPATGGFSFGTAPAAAPTPSSSGFSFGAAKPAATAPASSSGFSFGLSTTPAASSGFAVGATPASATTTPGAGEDEDEENVGREEATVILKSENADDDCVFEADKAKVLEFKKDEKRWADKGTHPIKVLVNKTTKNARILVRNEIGKIVLNSSLYKGLAIKPHEAKGKKTGALLALQVDGSLTQFILKVSGEKVDAFLTALEDSTPK